MKWRLGLDIGTSSIGWAIFEIEDNSNTPKRLVDAGVRIFPDGRDNKKQSLAVERRDARQARRTRDRYLMRRDEFMARLKKHGLMPHDSLSCKELEKLDPWTLRIKGLDERLELYELGRALFHLQQRRGFKSNRKTDKNSDNEKGKIKQASLKLKESMSAQGARTFGELLAKPRCLDPREAHNHSVRARLKGEGSKTFYDFYPTRDLIEQEFDEIWEVQKRFHGIALTEQAYKDLKDTLLFQRELKPQPVGKCTLNLVEERAPSALPSVQRIRIFQEINNLKINIAGGKSRPISLEERDSLTEKALSVKELKFSDIKKLLKIPEESFLNLEANNRKKLDGNLISSILTGKKIGWKEWHDLNLLQQDAVVEILMGQEEKSKNFEKVSLQIATALKLENAIAKELLKTNDENVLVDWLVEYFQIDHEIAVKVVNANLPVGHSNLGRTAINKVLPLLESDVIPFADCVAKAYPGYTQLDYDGQYFRSLPYYGQLLERHVAFGTGDPNDIAEKRYGKIANPTVHVALNQLRRVINSLIKRIGSQPKEIIVELARDLPLSAEGKRKLENEQNKNKKDNEIIKERLNEQNIENNYDNRLRYKLWEELNESGPLDKICPYTGKKISISMLFTDEVEIDHILPFRRTFDDSRANKIICLRKANRDKGNNTPYEFFSSNTDGYDWEKIVSHSGNLPPNKRWRFAADAMERYENENDFLDRQLNDTRYISRIAKTYLRYTGADVWVTPGRLTSDLRWAWGLESVLLGHNANGHEYREKNRNDHRHHAIDAIVIGLTDRGLLNRISRISSTGDYSSINRVLSDLDEPIANFRSEVCRVIGKLIVSHKPDHGVQGALHNDTAYGLINGADATGKRDVVHRVPLSTIKKFSDLEKIRDEVIKEKLMANTEGLSGKEFTEALSTAGECMFPPVRKVRIVEKMSVIPIIDKNGLTYKAYKGDSNYCYDIFSDDNGKWTGEIVTTFNANKPIFNFRSNNSENGKPVIMRIRKNDIIAISENDNIRYMRVVKFSLGKIYLAEHFEAGPLKNRDASDEDDFKYQVCSPGRLQNLNSYMVQLDPSGHIKKHGKY